MSPTVDTRSTTSQPRLPAAPDRRGHPMPRLLGALALAAGLVGVCTLVWQLWWTDVQATHRTEALVASMREDFDAASAGAEAVAAPAPAAATALLHHEPAVVHLPTVGEELPVLGGVGEDVLDQGVLGRYPNATSPGEVGNYAVAGHRTTHGRPLWALGELAAGDPIVVETASGYHLYLFSHTRVVSPDDVSVLAPNPDEPGTAPTEAWMVLTTCHPRFSAAERLIGYAVLDRTYARSEGPPPHLGRGGTS